jgi:PEP-CTERM motif-containing protein
MKRPIILLFCALCLCALSGLRAATIDQNTAGPSTGGTGFYGENFITPASSSFDNIVFTFLTTGGANFASGTGFLLSAEYLGPPSGLSNSTTGFLGQATASGNFYTFASGITLAPSTTYYFYENISINSGIIFGGNSYPGHQFYFSSASGTNFSGQGGPLNFRVTGNPVPEPSTTALFLSAGLAGLFVVRRAKRS